MTPSNSLLNNTTTDEKVNPLHSQPRATLRDATPRRGRSPYPWGSLYWARSGVSDLWMSEEAVPTLRLCYAA